MTALSTNRWLGQLLGAGITFAAVAYVFIVGFPAERFAIGAGLDASWTYGINLAAEQGLIFGRDIVFTYGPFGYLRSPVLLGSNLPKAVIFQLGLHLALCGLLLSIAAKTRRPQNLLIWALGFSAALALGLSYEYQIVGIAILLACASTHLFRHRWMLVSSGALTAFLFFMRPGVGLLVLAATAGLIFAAWPAGRAWLVTSTCFTLAGVVAAVLLVASVRFGSIESFSSWLRLSAQMMSGFDVAMSLPGSRAHLLFALAAAALFFAPLLRGRSRQGRLCLALSPAVFLCFKHTFVRQDLEHVFTMFFGFMVVLAASIPLFLEEVKERRTAAVVLLCLALLGVGLRRHHGRFPWEDLTDVFTGAQGVRKLRDTLALKSQLAAFDRLSAQSLSADALPAKWLDVIARQGGTALPFPTEISICALNHLRCKLYPTLQAYAAYTGVLDQWSASIFESRRAPDFVIAEFASIDGRSVWFDVPITWRSLLTHYRLVDSEEGRRLLLEKRVAPPEARRVSLSPTAARFGQWIRLPPAEGMLIGAPRLKLSRLGFWRKTLYKIAPVELEVRYQSGESARWRFVPSTAERGLLLSVAPRSGRELADIFLRAPIEAITEFRIVGPGTASFEGEFQVNWWATVPFALEKKAPKE